MITTAANSDHGKMATDKSRQAFWQYDGKSANCQDFVGQVVADNGLYDSLPEKTRILMDKQDANQLVMSLGPLSDVPAWVTGAASVLDRTIHGDGLRSGGTTGKRGGSLRPAANVINFRQSL